jgi:hypothetical protein
MALSSAEIPHTAKKYLTTKKKTIMAGIKKVSRREVFKKCNKLPLAHEFFPSSLSFVVVNT